MKNFIISIITVILLLTVVGWYFYSSQQESPPGQQSSETIYSDSIDAQDQPTFSQQQDTVKEPVGEDLAPGTALVRATIQSVEHQDEKLERIKVVIEEVVGYGSSTAPISSNAEMEVEVQNVVARGDEAEDQLKEGVEVLLVIEGSTGMQSGGDSDGKKWRLIEFKIP
ncbi:MAG: hypothetical protein ACQEST_01390 [Bacteroidota bacterium]